MEGKIMESEIIEIDFDATKKNQDYAGPKHTIYAKSGKKIKFTTKNSPFEVRIHNENRFFYSEDDILLYYITKKDPKTTPEINNKIHKDTIKYYIAYCVKNDDYADRCDASPPKIIIVD